MERTVRVRYAPSPTGHLHIGNLRTALYNWFFARRHGGTFILRVEDTDRSRFVEGATEKLYASLVKCGLTPDEGLILEAGQTKDVGSFGPYLQSQRRDKHLAYAYELIEKDYAYYCFCSKERLEQVTEKQRLLKQPIMYDRHCRNLSKQEAEKRAAVGEEHVIRLKVPLEGRIVMNDMIRGWVEIPWSQIDDQVLIKSDGYPTYHLAATCDDHDMEITHVIRGEEWLSSLPKHLFIFKAMGWIAPEHAHLPLLLNPDKSKLSKRQGDVALEDYLAKGYLPEALINFVALLGWNPTADREIFSKEELAQLFDITHVNKSGAVFNLEKLDWMNSHYIKHLAPSDYIIRLRELGLLPEGMLAERAARVAQERLVRLSDLPEALKDAMECAAYESQALVWKKSSVEDAKLRLAGLKEYLAAKDEVWFGNIKKMEEETRAWIIEKGWSNGDVLWPLRVALSGRERSPSPFELMFVAGKGEVLQRLDVAIAKLA